MENQHILKEWEWKYKIFFDEKTKQKVYDFSRNLPMAESEIFLKQVDFYESFYTIDILMNALKNEYSNKKEIINKALSHINLCQKTHPSIKNLILKDINSFPEYLKNDLLKIYKHSLNTTKFVDFNDYLKISFSKEQLININQTVKLNAKNEMLEDNDMSIISGSKKHIKDIFNENLKDISRDLKIIENFGVFSLKNYDVKILEDEGFGEWWDSDLYDEYKNDTLVLYSNSKSMNKNDFLYTILHEVYPGHGHFFNQTKRDNKIIDTGAFLLIEGYATFVEINTIQSQYSSNLRTRYAKTIDKLLNFDYDNLNPSLIRSSTQMIGYIESYYFGAFAIETIVEGKYRTPKELLDFLNKNIKGDFFKLW